MKRLKRVICNAFLGKKRKTKFNAENIKKILILRNDKVGDMIVSTPLLRELKNSYPEMRIDVAASSINADVVKECPHVGKIIIWDKKSTLNVIRAIWAIRREQYDVIFSTSNIFSFPYLMRIKLLQAKYLIGFNIEKYGTNTKHLGMYDYTVDCVRDRHILENYFSAFAHFKLKAIDYRYELFGVEAQAAKSKAFFMKLKKTYKGFVCFNYQGSSVARTIGKEDARRLCAEIADKYDDYALIVIYPPGASAQAAAVVKAIDRKNVLLAFGTDNILELASLIKECDVVISPDTAVIHVASVYNKKILGFYINTDNYKWFYPRCDHFKIMLSKKEQLRDIDTEATLKAFDELMAA